MNAVGRLLYPLQKKLLFAVHSTSTTNIGLLPQSLGQLRLCASQPSYGLNHQVCLEFQDEEKKITHDTIAKVNEHVKAGKEGRLFAVVHLCGKQFKITAEDLVILEGHWAPQIGDEIKLEKVLLVGGKDFTLVGRPVLPQGLVTITAQVIEKDLSQTKIIFFKKRRKQYMNTNFYRSLLTMLRIKEIKMTGEVNKPPNVEQYSQRI